MRRRIIAVLLCADFAVMAVIAFTAVDLSRSVTRSAMIGHVAHAVVETERRYVIASRVLLRGA